MEFAAPIPIFRIFDEAKAREFYLGFLGFELTFEARFEPQAPIYMGVQLDSCRLHLSEHHGDASPGSCVRVLVSDVKKYHEALLGKKYKYNRPGIHDTEWGTREVTVYDGFGNRLIFFSPL